MVQLARQLAWISERDAEQAKRLNAEVEAEATN